MKIYLLILTLLFSSCSSLVNKHHKNFDEEEAEKRSMAPSRGKDKFSIFRKRPRMLSKKDPSSTGSNTNLSPVIKRNYQPMAPRRTTANDLVDSEPEGSLWAGKGQSNFLFSKNIIKQNGDIVVVKIMSKMKDEITVELGRAFPARAKKKKDDKSPAGAAEPEKEKTESTDNDKVYDIISGVVVEEIGKDHLLIRGKKDVLYKKRKRKVEIEALAARKDISDDDTINSSQLLESNISILR